MLKKNELYREVAEQPAVRNMLSKLNDSERRLTEEIIESFMSPCSEMINILERLRDDPEFVSKFERALAESHTREGKAHDPDSGST